MPVAESSPGLPRGKQSCARISSTRPEVHVSGPGAGHRRLNELHPRRRAAPPAARGFRSTAAFAPPSMTRRTGVSAAPDRGKMRVQKIARQLQARKRCSEPDSRHRPSIRSHCVVKARDALVRARCAPPCRPPRPAPLPEKNSGRFEDCRDESCAPIAMSPSTWTIVPTLTISPLLEKTPVQGFQVT